VDVGTLAVLQAEVANDTSVDLEIEPRFEGSPAFSAFDPTWVLPAKSTTRHPVIFSPDVPGSLDGTILLAPCASCAGVEISLSGIGLSYEMSVAPPLLDFGSVNVDSLNDLPLRVENTGTAPLRFEPFPAYLAPFYIDLVPDLEPGESATVHAHYAPASTGQHLSVAYFADKSAGRLANVRLKGHADSGFTMTPPVLDFGRVPLSTPIGKTLRVASDGSSGDTRFPSASIDGSDSASFSLKPAFGPQDVGRTEFETTVYVEARQVGSMSASVIVATDDPSRPFAKVPITATGVASRCSVATYPRTLEDRLVPVGAETLIYVENRGTTDCQIDIRSKEYGRGFWLKPKEAVSESIRIPMDLGCCENGSCLHSFPGCPWSETIRIRIDRDDTTEVAIPSSIFPHASLRASPIQSLFGDVPVGTEMRRTRVSLLRFLPLAQDGTINYWDIRNRVELSPDSDSEFVLESCDLPDEGMPIVRLTCSIVFKPSAPKLSAGQILVWLHEADVPIRVDLYGWGK